MSATEELVLLVAAWAIAVPIVVAAIAVEIKAFWALHDRRRRRG